LAQITAPPVTASHAPKGFLQSRRGWALAVAVWVLVGVLVAVVFWALPRAASSRRLAEQTSSLRVSLSQASAALDLAKAELASLQVKLDDLKAARDTLDAQATKNAGRITALNKQIKALEKKKKEAEAAAAAAASHRVGTSRPPISIPPPPRPSPCITIGCS